MDQLPLSLVRALRGAALVLGLLALASPARAELVFFASGRSLSVKSVRADGDSLVLALRGGGEIICERSSIVRVEPDEVPYPEPVALALAPAPIPSAAPIPLSRSYGELIDKLAAEHRVSARLVKAVIQVESGYQQHARSPKGAMGLMQLMPETARQYAVADPYEARSNIEGGIKYLKSLLERFELPLALAAYNAGEAAVRRFGGIPPFRETQNYVLNVRRLAGL